MADDTPDVANTGIAQADALYRGFPDFSAWAKLSPTDTDLWDRFAAGLQERRNAATPEALKAAVEVAVRAAALDTGAIEGLYTVDRGFTMTVAVQGLAWEQMIEERGAGVRELFEAQLEAYELVLDAVTHERPITEVWIRSLHTILCAPQKTYRVLTDVGWQEQDLPKGQYKTRSNHVRLTDGTYHAYAPVDQVASEMHRLIEQISTPEFEAAHPVLQASYCHYAFVVIHPFADGNGRVARALASIFFYRAQSIPLVIFANQKPTYWNALHVADLGDLRPVISFFRDRGIDTMQMVTESLRASDALEAEAIASRLYRLAESRPAPSLKELIDIASRIRENISEEFNSSYHKLSLPSGFSYASKRLGDRPPAPHKYRQENEGLLIILEGLGTQISRAVRVLISTALSNPFEFRIEVRHSDDFLDVRLDDVDPALTPSFQLRLSSWVQRHLGRMLADIEKQVS